MIRLKRRREFADLLRSYRIVVDDDVIGRIRSGGEVRFDVAPGRHHMHLRIDWCRSNTLEFWSDGKTLELECGSNLAGFRSLRALRYLLAPDGDYLWLRPATGAVR